MVIQEYLDLIYDSTLMNILMRKILGTIYGWCEIDSEKIKLETDLMSG